MRFFARRLFLLGAVVAALAMLMAPALAGADDDDDDDGGGGDRAFCAPAGPPQPGQCRATGVFNRLDFDARSGPGGENPTGTFRFDFNVDDFVEGQVTCLDVTGNLASFGGTITDSSFSFLVGQGTGLTVMDGGSFDTTSGADFFPGGGPPAGTPNCGRGPGTAEVVIQGDIVVQDNIAGGDDEDDDDEDDEDDEDDDDD